MKRAVIDIETILGVFTLTALDYDSDSYVQFVISDYQNDFYKMKEFLNTIEYFIGFNSIHFDETVLLYILDNNIQTASEIYKVAQNVIEFGDNNDLNQIFRKYKYNKPWKSIDLFLYWSKGLRQSKKLSLKYFAVNLEMKIQEMPIHHSKKDFTKDEILEVLDYNLNDVKVTKVLGKKLSEEINLRVWIKEEYNLDCLSWDAPKIANELLLEDYCSKTWDGSCKSWEYKKKVRASRYINEGFRNGDYLPEINFKTQTFKDLYKEICNSENGFKKDLIYKQADGSRIIISYGSGGIHTVNKEERYISDNNSTIYTSDVASLYPNLLINYKFIRPDLYPVLDQYISIKEQRIMAKKNKDKKKDALFKLILNALTGLLDNEHSWLYSPAEVMALRLTGQLLLTRLLEECTLNSLIIRSLNTDGCEVIIPKGKEDLYFSIIHTIEQEFNIIFEHEKYKFINYSTVNDYICQTFEGKIKVKGDFIYEKVLDGSNEFLIIPIAVKEYFVNSIPIEQTIKNHKNIYDFTCAKKIDKKYQVFYNNQKVQQLNRFYCSKKGAYLYKMKEDKTTMEHVFGESGVIIVNDIVTVFPQDIDYQFYIRKTMDKIRQFEKSQLSLF